MAEIKREPYQSMVNFLGEDMELTAFDENHTHCDILRHLHKDLSWNEMRDWINILEREENGE